VLLCLSLLFPLPLWPWSIVGFCVLRLLGILRFPLFPRRLLRASSASFPLVPLTTRRLPQKGGKEAKQLISKETKARITPRHRMSKQWCLELASRGPLLVVDRATTFQWKEHTNPLDKTHHHPLESRHWNPKFVPSQEDLPYSLSRGRFSNGF
jgi:hypothetical protein